MRGRPYSKISPRLVTGSFGRSIRGEDKDSLLAQSASGYVCYGPHKTAIGVYFLPVGYLMADRGWSEASAKRALEILEERGLIRYNWSTEWVWVIEGFRHEFGADPARTHTDTKKDDSRLELIRRLLDEAAGSGLAGEFIEYHRPEYPYLLGWYDGPCNAPSDPVATPRGTGGSRARVRVQDQDQDQDQEERDPSGLVGDPDGSTDDTPDPPDPKKTAARNGYIEELRWRIEQVWEAHLDMRRRYWQRVEYQDQPPGPAPSLTAPRRKLIGDALRRQDGELLGPDLREAWSRDSKVRAAAIGIFLDKWCGARAEGNQLAEGGKRYLEPERAFRVINKLDQVERFAELYFERRARKERASRVEPEDHELEKLRDARWEAAREHGEHSPEVDALETEILKRI